MNALPFVWKVTYRHASDTPLYLIGSMHSVMDDAVSAAKSYIQEADAVYAESVAGPNEASLLFKPGHYMIPDGKTIDDLLGPEQGATLVRDLTACYRQFYHGIMVRKMMKDVRRHKIWHTCLSVRGLERRVVFGTGGGITTLEMYKKSIELSIQLQNASVFGLSQGEIRRLSDEFDDLQRKLNKREMQCKKPETVDEQLVHYAKSVNKPALALDRADDYAAVFDSISVSLQQDYLYNLIQEIVNHDASRKGIKTDQNLFHQGDLGALERELEKTFQGDPKTAAFFKQVTIGRTLCWYPVIREDMKNRRLVVIAGVYHMLGEQGFPALFRADGYDVVRL